MKFGIQFSKLICYKIIKRFPPHLNNVSTLPCETWNAHHARFSIELFTQRNSRIYPYLTVASKFARLESSWLQCVSIEEKMYKIRILIWTNWNSDWERSGPSCIMSLRQRFVRGVVDSSRSVMCVLYTFSCNIFHTLLSTGFKSGEFGATCWAWNIDPSTSFFHPYPNFTGGEKVGNMA